MLFYPEAARAAEGQFTTALVFVDLGLWFVILRANAVGLISIDRIHERAPGEWRKSSPEIMAGKLPARGCSAVVVAGPFFFLGFPPRPTPPLPPPPPPLEPQNEGIYFRGTQRHPHH